MTEQSGYDQIADARFRAKILVNETGCWVWQGTSSRGTTNPQRYAMFHYHKPVRASRWAYQRWVGPIPEGMWIDHLCHNTMCVNPKHLEAVTPRENILRGEGLAAQAARRDTCAKGHPYPEDMRVQLWPDGRFKQRVCRVCKNEWNRLNRPSRAKP